MSKVDPTRLAHLRRLADAAVAVSRDAASRHRQAQYEQTVKIGEIDRVRRHIARPQQDAIVAGIEAEIEAAKPRLAELEAIAADAKERAAAAVKTMRSAASHARGETI